MLHGAASLFLALAIIVALCQLLQRLCARIRQPVVIGEMIAGVILGPSLLGALLPDAQRALFNPDVLSALDVISQVGLVLFMFTVGLEFSPSKNRGSASVGIGVSLIGVAVPLALGVGFVYLVHDHTPLLPDGVPLLVGALFVGLLLAITAFPVMARIIDEQGLTNTRYGSLSLAAGAIDDVGAWILMAVVLAMAGATATGAVWLAVGGLAGFVVVLLLLRPLLRRVWATGFGEGGKGIAVALTLMLLCAWVTEGIGVHGVIGAFALGVIFPPGDVSERMIAVVRPVTVALFLPLFFAYSGLQTDFRALASPAALAVGAALVAIAFIAKLGSCSVTAKIFGETWYDSTRIGFLMNTRGLMQLVALNIGLQAGLVAPPLFAMIVVVAIVTTLAAVPGLTLVDRIEARRATVEKVEQAPAPINDAATSPGQPHARTRRGRRRGGDTEHVHHTGEPPTFP